MSLRMGALYDALRSGQGISDEAAKQAAEEVADYDARIGRIERDLNLLKWMVGTNVALTLLVLGGMAGMFWRLLPLVRP